MNHFFYPIIEIVVFFFVETMQQNRKLGQSINLTQKAFKLSMLSVDTPGPVDGVRYV